jgi:molecular chaperone HscC
MFGQFPNASINPDEVVARGAAVQAALKANAAELGERVMTDVCPYTLGVAVSRRVGEERKVDGMMSPILPRNTVIPASRVEVFYPSHPQQTVASIKVYQGEARLVRDNILLGEVELPMPLPPAGQQHDRSLSVRFTYDVDGLLEVEGTPLRDGVPSGETRRLVIQSSAERLSDAQVQERLAALAALKLHPRDRMEVRTLLARAERLFTQLRVEEREPFGNAITRFELVLDGQDPRQIEAAQLELLAMVRQMESLTPLGL